MDENSFEEYKVTRGAQNNFGERYELIFLVHTALKLSFDNRRLNFKFSSNNKDFHCFDDAVFEIYYENSKKKTIFCVQLKHRNKVDLTEDNVAAPNETYSLDTFYKSYKKIKKNDDLKNAEIFFVLFITGGFDRSIESFQWNTRRIQKVLIPEVEAIPLDGECFRFDTISQDQDINGFFSRFFIYTRQSKCEEMEEETRKLILQRFGHEVDISEGLLNYVDKWRQGLYGGHYIMTRNEFVCEVCSLLLSPYLIVPTFKKEEMNFVNLWNEAVESVDVTFIGDDHISKIWHCILEKNIFGGSLNKFGSWERRCIILKDVNYVCKHYFLSKSLNDQISLKDLCVILWKMGKLPLFLINNDALIKIFEFALTAPLKKYFIVLRNEKIQFPNCRVFNNLSALADGIVTKFLKFEISIQNRFTLPLKEIRATDKITSDVLFEISDNNIVGLESSKESSKEPEIFIKLRISHEDGNVDEEDNLFFNHSNLVNIISAPPGMGKSTLLSQICKTKTQNSKFWILKIKLIEHRDCLQNISDSIKADSNPLDYFRKKIYGNSELTEICFDSFEKSGKILILLDGFEEICAKFGKAVFNIIKYFKARGLRQWITTRPRAALILEKKFNVVSHSVLPLDSKQKEDFVKKYCAKNISIDLQNQFLLLLSGYEKNLENFLDNTLHMSMLCDIVKSDLKKSSTYRIYNILHLYEEFVDKKIRILQEKYLKGNENVVYLTDCLEKHLKLHTILLYQAYSMDVFFGKTTAQRVLPKYFMEQIQKGCIYGDVGIIIHVCSDNVPIFVHKTYAEYFAATWFVENWHLSEVSKTLLQEVFFFEKYSGLKLFFDMMVSKEIDLFQAVLDQNTTKIHRCENVRDVDELKRTALHLACSWKSKTDRECLKILIENIDPTSDALDSLGLTPINYAIRTKNVVALDEMLKKYSFNLSISEICTDIQWVLRECIQGQCTKLLFHFMEILNSSQDWKVTSDYNNLLLAAVEMDNVQIIKILLSSDKIRKHIKNSETQEHEPSQFATIVGNETVARMMADVA